MLVHVHVIFALGEREREREREKGGVYILSGGIASFISAMAANADSSNKNVMKAQHLLHISLVQGRDPGF